MVQNLSGLLNSVPGVGKDTSIHHRKDTGNGDPGNLGRPVYSIVSPFQEAGHAEPLER